jgi:N-acetylmuramoyl-L-alanine amidase
MTNTTILRSISLALVFCCSCTHLPKTGEALKRTGDEIVIAGQFFHTGSPVVLWLDPGGYDGYRVERRFAPFSKSDWSNSARENSSLTTPNRYGLRQAQLTDAELENVRGGGWDLPTLQRVVDQFVIHFDASGTSRQCFKVLHDQRDLSVHFMLDLDGTIYQTVDVKERAWHATTSNTRSIGIEIANIGAFPSGEAGALNRWYKKGTNGWPEIQIPTQFQPTGIRDVRVPLRPARAELVKGKIQGEELVQYDFTAAQYEALAKLTATLCRVFPHLPCDYPKDVAGQPLSEKLPDDQLQSWQGLLGHFHVQRNKADPGPAFQWEKVAREARHLLKAR